MIKRYNKLLIIFLLLINCISVHSLKSSFTFIKDVNSIKKPKRIYSSQKTIKRIKYPKRVEEKIKYIKHYSYNQKEFDKYWNEFMLEFGDNPEYVEYLYYRVLISYCSDNNSYDRFNLKQFLKRSWRHKRYYKYCFDYIDFRKKNIFYNLPKLKFNKYYQMYIKEFPEGTYYIDINKRYNRVNNIMLRVHGGWQLFNTKNKVILSFYVSNIKNVSFYLYKKNQLFEIDPIKSTNAKSKEILIQEFDKSFHKNSSTTLDLGYLEPGYYTLEVKSLLGNHSINFHVSDIGCISKYDNEKIVLYTINILTGKPVEGALIKVGFRNEYIAHGVTNEDGLAVLDLTEIKSYSSERISFQIFKDGNRVRERVSLYNKPGKEVKKIKKTMKSFIYTDRPIYRPGDIVHFKAIIRNASKYSRIYSIPEEKEFTIGIGDPTGKIIFKKQYSISEFGTINGSYKLFDEAKPGGYQFFFFDTNNKKALSWSGDFGNIWVASFTVQEYKKPEFFVNLKYNPEKSRTKQVGVDIDVNYYFGKEVPFARIDYNVDNAPLLKCRWSGYYYRSNESPRFYTGGSLCTDKLGHATLKFKRKNPREEEVYIIKVKVTDKFGRVIRDNLRVRIKANKINFNIKTDKNIYNVKDKINCKIEIKDLHDRFISMKGDLLVYKIEEDNKRLIKRIKLQTNEISPVTHSFTLPERGKYKFKFRANRGEYESEKIIYVIDETYTDNFKHEYNTVYMSKDKYITGDLVDVIIETKYDKCFALISLEGNKLFQYEVMELTAPTNHYQFKILPEYGNNLSINVVICKDRMYDKIREPIKIIDTIILTVTSDKSSYRPGDLADFTVEVKNANNEPIDCELSLAIIDESLCSLKGNYLKQIYNFFPRPEKRNRVSSDQIRLNRDRKSLYSRYEHAIVCSSSSGGSLKDKKEYKKWQRESLIPKLKAVKARELFLDTWHWVPAVSTDSEGKFNIRLKVPDNITSWIAQVIVVTKDSRFAFAEHQVKIFTDFFIRLDSPRFITWGDKMEIRVNLHNYTGEEKKVITKFDGDGFNISGDKINESSVSGNDEKSISWDISCDDPGDSVTMTIKSIADTYSDGIKLILPVVSFGMRQVKYEKFLLDEHKDSEEITFELPKTAILKTAKVNINLTTLNPINSILTSLKYLKGYPYGCIEQTVSRFYPTLVVKESISQLGLETDVRFKELPDMINTGLERLYHFQNKDGGWGWWPDNKSSPTMTVYVMRALSYAKRIGVDVNQEIYDRGIERLRQFYMDLKFGYEKITIARFLIKREDINIAEIKKYYEDKKYKSERVKAIYALTFYSAGEFEYAAEIIKELKKKVTYTKYGAYLNDYRSSALLLQALLKISPKDELVHHLVSSLLIMKRGKHWRNTWDTARVILALNDYIKEYGLPTDDVKYKIYVNDTLLSDEKINYRGKEFSKLYLDLDYRSLKVGENTIRIEKTGTYLFGDIIFEYYDESNNIESSSKNVKVIRKYNKIFHKKDKYGRDKLERVPVEDQINQGDEIEVELVVKATGKGVEYLMIEDYFPSGCEVRGTDKKSNNYRYYYPRLEVRDEKVVFFIKKLSRSYTFRYRLLPIIPGTYNVYPTIVTSMYNPEVYANSNSMKLTILEKNKN